MIRILIVGDALIDRTLKCRPKGLSPEAPIVNWEVQEAIDLPGGAANVAINVYQISKALGEAEVIFAGPISEEIYKITRYSGCPQVFREINDSRRTSIKSRIVNASPFQQIVRFDSDNRESFPLEDLNSFIAGLLMDSKNQKFDVAIVSDYGAGSISKGVLAAVGWAAKKVVVDPKGNDLTKYIGCDLICPNLRELNDLVPAGKHEQEKADYLSNSLRNIPVIVKRGGRGCCLYLHGVGHEIVPSRFGPEIDPTGAGDTFIASLASALAFGQDLFSSVVFANAMGGMSVTKPLCYFPSKSEVEQVIQSLAIENKLEE